MPRKCKQAFYKEISRFSLFSFYGYCVFPIFDTTHLLNHSLNHSLTQSLTHRIIQSLTRSHSHPHTFIHTITSHPTVEIDITTTAEKVFFSNVKCIYKLYKPQGRLNYFFIIFTFFPLIFPLQGICFTSCHRILLALQNAIRKIPAKMGFMKTKY